MLRIGLAPCSPFTVTTDLMVAAAALARRYEGVRLHTHLAENQEDIDYSLEVYGCRPGQYIKCAPAVIHEWQKLHCQAVCTSSHYVPQLNCTCMTH